MEQILQRLEKVRKSGDGYLACCPVHDDRSPSMTIKDVGDKILMYCFSCGAKGDEIIKALGLPTSVIFKDEGKTDFDKKTTDRAGQRKTHCSAKLSRTPRCFWMGAAS